MSKIWRRDETDGSPSFYIEGVFHLYGTGLTMEKDEGRYILRKNGKQIGAMFPWDGLPIFEMEEVEAE